MCLLPSKCLCLDVLTPQVACLILNFSCRAPDQRAHPKATPTPTPNLPSLQWPTQSVEAVSQKLTQVLSMPQAGPLPGPQTQEGPGGAPGAGGQAAAQGGVQGRGQGGAQGVALFEEMRRAVEKMQGEAVALLGRARALGEGLDAAICAKAGVPLPLRPTALAPEACGAMAAAAAAEAAPSAGGQQGGGPPLAQQPMGVVHLRDASEGRGRGRGGRGGRGARGGERGGDAENGGAASPLDALRQSQLQLQSTATYVQSLQVSIPDSRRLRLQVRRSTSDVHLESISGVYLCPPPFTSTGIVRRHVCLPCAYGVLVVCSPMVCQPCACRLPWCTAGATLCLASYWSV